jgi:uncharacterized protein (TIGR02145 family)
LSAVLNDSPQIRHLLAQGKSSVPQAGVAKATVSAQIPTPTAASTTVTAPVATTVSGNTITDSRDGQQYRIVKIGNQTWMAENLNYNASGSKCYNNSEFNCNKYGRLYRMSTINEACPSGWHLPDKGEWDELSNFVGGSKTDAKHLKAKRGWDNNGNGQDSYGFVALPGGYGTSAGGSTGAGTYGGWWSVSESGNDIYNRSMYNDREFAHWHGYGENYMFSVRCAQD